MNMYTNMGTTVYWHKNQVITRLKLKGSLYRIGDEQIENLRTHDPIKFVLNELDVHVDPQLIDVHQPPCCDSDGNSELLFCHGINPKTRSKSDMESMQGNGTAAGMGNQDHTLALINQINKNFHLVVKEGRVAEFSETFNKALDRALNGAQRGAQPTSPLVIHDLLDFKALPRWLKAATPDGTSGCPISPPIPVEGLNTPGRWKLEFSGLRDDLKNATGKGVTVLVLDTLPTRDQISRAAEKAGSSNTLLKEMTDGMSWEAFDAAQHDKAVPPAINCRPQFIPDVVEGTPPERVITGKDIYGRHGGFPMEDHGMFITGIVRDLAPEANIECIRVLNDFGVGDICTLYDALTTIYDRMSEGGDLHGKPVVINLSLVVLPPEDDVPEGVAEDILESTRDALYMLLQCLVNQGAIFVAAAGNDSDPRMNASEKRFGPRYPAALAFDDHAMTAMISVGAVNRNRQAARYSNYPGPYGIATYAGDLPKPEPWLPSAMDHIVASVDTSDIDALCGVYTAAQYPPLSKNDPYRKDQVPNSKAWAYWSGTSFATPIISALAARVLQGRDSRSIDVRQVILDAVKDEVIWTEVGLDSQDIPGPMIMVEQGWYPGGHSQS